MHLPSLPIIINHILSPWTAHVKLFYLISEIPDSLLVFQKHRPKKKKLHGSRKCCTHWASDINTWIWFALWIWVRIKIEGYKVYWTGGGEKPPQAESTISKKHWMKWNHVVTLMTGHFLWLPKCFTEVIEGLERLASAIWFSSSKTSELRIQNFSNSTQK